MTADVPGLEHCTPNRIEFVRLAWVRTERYLLITVLQGEAAMLTSYGSVRTGLDGRDFTLVSGLKQSHH